ncbi:hypothetical protein Poli38472_006273 [Pythium oligandrum]|uniref:Syndetin n=1 Tax=Pythium oligandrum TaxID=41045 RepID=A0A8K1FM01_PYTOL|nr:hypothetical protein Poli38472_006273 [Pythium oligandrum]|eukprot:TMW68805.1 hypothetical protein Poli38472_006273 [Pythium oligandrum]
MEKVTTATPPRSPAKERRRITTTDLREEIAAATTALKEQKWVKMLADKVARRERGKSDVSEMEEDVEDKMNASPRNGEEGKAPLSPSKLAGSTLVPTSADEVIDMLDPRFFTESFDGVAYALENLPTTREEIDEYLQTEISAVEAAKDIVVSRLAEDVRSNQDAFIQGMKLVQDVDLDLVRAQIHVKNGRRLLVTSKNDLIRSSLEIVKIKRNRDRVESIIELGSQILRFFEEEERMNEALQNHSFTTAVDISLALRTELASPELQDVAILKKIMRRVRHFLPELRTQFDKSLRKVAQEFDPVRYRELLQAYITLADHAENLGFEFTAVDLNDVLSNIPEIIVRCIHDLSRQYLADLLAPRPSPRKPKAANSTSGVRPARSSISTTSTATQTMESVRQAYERLTELMHTYYMIVQWHRDPFNPHNDDMTYLHRCGIDDDDDDDDEDDEDEEYERHDHDENRQINADGTPAVSPRASQSGDTQRKGSTTLMSPRRRRNTSVSSEQGSRNGRSPYSQILCETGMTLLRYRKIVWENMQQNVLEALERLDTASGMKFEHIVTLSQATTVFIDVGEEFTGTPSTMLRSILRLKCEQYITSFHEDNLELLRMLADTENWQRILNTTSTVRSTDDMIRLVENRSGYNLLSSSPATMGKNCDQELGNPAIHERSVFPSFSNKGNPFSSMNVAQWLSSKLQSKDQDGGGDNNGVDLSEQENPAKDDLSPETPEADQLDIDDIDEFILTSSSLSGFVRLCGVYLKMMNQLPQSSWDIFLLLIKLLEFNLYVVFTSFTTSEQAMRLFQSQLPDTAEWLTLRSCISRIAREYNSGEIIVQTTIVPVASTKIKSTPGTSGKEGDVTLRRLTRLPSVLELPRGEETHLHAFTEQSVAAAAIVSQTSLLQALKPLVASFLASRYHCLMDEAYEQSIRSAQELQSFVYASAAISALDPGSVITSIHQVQWDIPYLSERHNEYVVSIVRRCGEIWGELQVFNDGVIPIDARDGMWGSLVQVAMDAMLGGFSSVPKCTPQGRALMSMDIIALQNGLDLINHVSRQRVRRGHEHVQRYIKAFYFDQDDLIEWIRQHKDAYTKVQIANLIRYGVGMTMPKKDLRALVLRIDALL